MYADPCVAAFTTLMRHFRDIFPNFPVISNIMLLGNFPLMYSTHFTFHKLVKFLNQLTGFGFFPAAVCPLITKLLGFLCLLKFDATFPPAIASYRVLFTIIFLTASAVVSCIRFKMSVMVPVSFLDHLMTITVRTILLERFHVYILMKLMNQNTCDALTLFLDVLYR